MGYILAVDKKHIESLFEQIESLKRIILEKEKPFLSMEEASGYLGLPKNTLYQYTSKKVLPYYKIGKRVYFKIDDLNQFILNEQNRFASIEELNREKFKSFR